MACHDDDDDDDDDDDALLESHFSFSASVRLVKSDVTPTNYEKRPRLVNHATCLITRTTEVSVRLAKAGCG